MEMHRSSLSVAIRAVLFAGAAVATCSAPIAFAQRATQGAPLQTANKKVPMTLQTIEVTGTHIRRAQIETDNPVVAVTARQIQQTGKLTAADLVARLPMVTGLLTNSPRSSIAGGSTLVGLRGLGASRTLILVDGQRIINKDLKSIPIEAIQRIEVLPSGASAIYGSDAIGGVINFILKDHYTGAQVSLNYGTSDHSDGTRKGGTFMFGLNSDKGNLLAAFSSAKFGAINFDSREWARHTRFLNANGDGFVPGGTNFAPRGFIIVPPTLSAKFGCPTGGPLSLNQSTFDNGTSPVGAGDFHCWGSQPGDLYDFGAHGNRIRDPSQSTNVLVNGVFHVTPTIDLYATYYHYKESQSIQVWPSVFGTRSVGGQTISADSYYNPFGVDFAEPNGSALSTLLFNIGTLRYFNSNTTTDQLISGVRGNLDAFGRRWKWDVGFNYGHISNNLHLIGWPDQPFLLKGLGPSFLNGSGVVQCGSPTAPISLDSCVPWDPFNLNSPSALAAVGQANAPIANSTWRIERTYHADINGGLLDLPAGTAQFAAGVLYRKEYSNNFIPKLQQNPPPPSTLLCGLGSACSTHLNGGFDVKEAYGELFVPLLKDLPFMHALNVTVADRYSRYSDFGSTNNWKVGIEYRPIVDLLLRGTVSRVFRAPTIGDLFTAPQSAATFLTKDPCDGITASGNPACVGVPTDGSFRSLYDNSALQLRAQQEGAVAAGFPIKPEKGTSFDFGAVYSPRQIPGFSVSADAWRIYLNDNITQISAQTVLDECSNGSMVFCKFIQRAQGGPGAGQLTLIILPEGNLGRIDVRGTDVSATYKLQTARAGQFSIGINATYLGQYKVQTAPGQVSNTVVDLAGTRGVTISQMFPRVQALASVHWTRGPWEAQWTLHYIGGFTDQQFQHRSCHESFSCFGAWIYNDASVGYRITPIDTLVQLGVDNLTNKQPPLLGRNIGNLANTDTNYYDVVGRFYWARMTVHF